MNCTNQTLEKGNRRDNGECTYIINVHVEESGILNGSDYASISSGEILSPRRHTKSPQLKRKIDGMMCLCVFCACSCMEGAFDVCPNKVSAYELGYGFKTLYK